MLMESSHDQLHFEKLQNGDIWLGNKEIRRITRRLRRRLEKLGDI